LKFEDPSRPIPLLHLPKNLDHKWIKQINNRILDYFTAKNEPEQDKINFLQFESNEYNGIIMFEEWKQRNKYWGKAKTTIIILTSVERAKIEQEMEILEPIFKKYISKIVQLEKEEAKKERYLILLQEFSDKITNSS
jgi:hypothetical protein